MKNFFLSSLVFFLGTTFSATAKNYYVAANGNNANSGLSASAPWQTIAKVNAAFASMLAGDSILFRRGDTFYGAIVVGKSGSSGRPIVISAYGSGNKPVITGFVTASSWAGISTGVYQCYIPGAKTTLNTVIFNNEIQALGRYPNADAANGGYLSYESFSGATSITDNQLTSSTNWVGAEVVVRKKLWVLDRGKITAHSGGTLTFTNTNSSTYTGTNGFGYFIQNDPRTLDKLGEWYFKTSTKYLQMYFGTASPSSYSVKVSCLDTLVRMTSRSYININNISFEGANGNAISATSGNYVNIQNCDFNNNGIGAINTQTVSNLLIENCTIRNSLSNAIISSASTGSNITIRGCIVKRTGALPGMGLSNGNSYKAIAANTTNLLIEYNTVDTSGYVGIDWQGSTVNVRYNVVNYFDFIKDDAGGIYTYAAGTDASPGKIYTNRTVSNNIVMNGAGAPNGRNSSTLFASGIYLDGRTMNVNVLNNTVFNNAKNGIHTSTAQGVTIRGNTSYNNLNGISVMRWASIGIIRNLAIKNNILYLRLNTQRAFYYVNSGLNEPTATTLTATLPNIGAIDSNTYNMINPTGFNFEVYSTTGGALIQASPYSLEAWKAISTKDPNGKKPVKVPVEYTIGTLVGANKFANGLFNTAISGLTVFAATGAWDNTGKISGGSLKISFPTPSANKYSLVHSPVGAVSAVKKYVLRFSTYGTTQQGIVRAYIRKTLSPYTNLTPIQTKTFGIGRKDHEFLFTAPTTDAGGSFAIELEQNSGITYIDNVSFYEVTATIYDPSTQLRFEYNPARVAKIISLGATYTDVNGATYTSVTLQPFTSIILVKDPAIAARPVADSTTADSASTDSTTFTARMVSDSVLTETTNVVSSDTTLGVVQDSAVAVVTDPVINTEKPMQVTAAANKAFEEKKTFSVSAYPNPSPNSFSVSLQGATGDKVTMQVFSLDGKLVHQTTGNGNSRFSFGNNLMPGVYILRVTRANTTRSLKIVKAGN